MKIKYLVFIGFIAIAFSFTNVNASSIDYNLRIDKDLHFYETITYNVDTKDIKSGNNYSFLTSVVNDDIYFDLKEENKYKKTKKKTANGYLVTLKYDYSYMFLTRSRIVNECFSNKDFNGNNSRYMSFKASDFYCGHRADNIKVSITTDLNVLQSNASSINSNNYTWENFSNTSIINFIVKIPDIESEPMDDIQTNDEDDNSSNNIEPEEENIKEEKHINKHVIISIVGALLITSVGVIIVLTRKNNSLNKI